MQNISVHLSSARAKHAFALLLAAPDLLGGRPRAAPYTRNRPQGARTLKHVAYSAFAAGPSLEAIAFTSVGV